MTTDPPNLDGTVFDPGKIDASRLRRLCTEKGIRRIRAYGSAVRGDFDPTRSDIDLLIDFLPGRTPGFGFFALGEELAEILGRKVDVSTERMLSEHFREEALHQAKVLYDAA
ncbi:MAG: nucleotidyltransferase family protein [Phycisphaerales bacterium]